MTHWMFSCSEISQKVSMSMDSRLPVHHRMAIRIHLMMCRYCARFHRQLNQLRAMSLCNETDTLPPEMPDRLSEHTRERIKASLRALYR